MDARHFDRLTRALSEAGTRRGLLGLLSTLPVVGGLVALFDFGGTGVHSVAGGMYVPDRWVYYSLIINWTDADAGSSTEVQDAYFAAARTIFALVRDRLGT